MLHEPMRTIGFICPTCRQAVIVEKSSFQLAASHTKIDCPCGGSTLEISQHNDKLRLQTPCLLCGETHTHTCSQQAFLHEAAVAFSCGVSGLDCCYVGEKEKVVAALTRLEETVDQLEGEAASEGSFLNPLAMQEILEELRDIGTRGDISCTCGKPSVAIQVSYSSVELVCKSCGGILKIPAATLRDVEDLCCKPVLQIRGGKG